MHAGGSGSRCEGRVVIMEQECGHFDWKERKLVRRHECDSDPLGNKGGGGGNESLRVIEGKGWAVGDVVLLSF